MQNNPVLIDDDNPEWTDEDFRKAVPFSALPESLQTTLRGLKGRGKQHCVLTVKFSKHFVPQVTDGKPG